MQVLAEVYGFLAWVYGREWDYTLLWCKLKRGNKPAQHWPTTMGCHPAPDLLRMLHSWSDGWMPWRIATWEWSVQHCSLVFLVLLRRTIACSVHSAKSGPIPYFTAQGLLSYLFKERICKDKESTHKIVKVIAWEEWIVAFHMDGGGSFQLAFCIKSINCTGCFSSELVKSAAEQDTAFPHTMADSQPLDIGCFGLLVWSLPILGPVVVFDFMRMI